MGIGLNFGIRWQYGDKRGSEELFHQAFVNLRKELVDWSPAFKFIAQDILEPFVEKQFETEGKMGGESWQELADMTVKYREHKGTTILYQSGALAHSFLEGEAQHVQNISPQKLEWGSIVPYALFHQTGTGKGFGKSRVATGPGTGRGMPMRKIIAMTDALREKMRRTMTGRIAQAARVMGFGVTPKGERAGLSPAEARRIGNIVLGLGQ